MMNGAHVILFSTDAETDWVFIRDVLGFAGVDTGGGWLIFKLPPAEIAVYPTDGLGKHECYLMFDDVEQTLADLAVKGVEISHPVSDEGWGGSPRSSFCAELICHSTSHTTPTYTIWMVDPPRIHAAWKRAFLLEEVTCYEHMEPL